MKTENKITKQISNLTNQVNLLKNRLKHIQKEDDWLEYDFTTLKMRDRIAKVEALNWVLNYK